MDNKSNPGAGLKLFPFKTLKKAKKFANNMIYKTLGDIYIHKYHVLKDIHGSKNKVIVTVKNITIKATLYQKVLKKICQ